MRIARPLSLALLTGSLTMILTACGGPSRTELAREVAELKQAVQARTEEAASAQQRIQAAQTELEAARRQLGELQRANSALCVSRRRTRDQSGVGCLAVAATSSVTTWRAALTSSCCK